MDSLFQIYNVSNPSVVNNIQEEENTKVIDNNTYTTVSSSINTNSILKQTNSNVLSVLNTNEQISLVPPPKTNITNVSSSINTNVTLLSHIPTPKLQLQSTISNNGNVIIPQTAFNEDTLYFGQGGGSASVSGVAPIDVSNNIISLNNSTVVPGVYTLAQITVDDKGIIQDASSGIIPPNDDWSNFPAATNVDMSGFLIENLGVPTKPNDATTKQYVDTLISDVSSSIVTLANDISSNYANSVNLTTNQDISGVKTFFNVPVSATLPTANDEVANKLYVDNAVSGVPIGNYLPLAGGTMSGNIDMSGNDIAGVGSISAGGVTESATFGSAIYPMLNHDVYATNVSVNSYNPLSAMNFIGVGGVNINAPDEDINLNAGDINLTQTQASSFMNLTATGSIVVAGALGVGITSGGTIQILSTGNVSIGSGNVLGADTEIEKVGFNDNTIYKAGANDLEISNVALIKNTDADLVLTTDGDTPGTIRALAPINAESYVNCIGDLYVNNMLIDSTTNAGTAGQVLTALVDGKVKWQTPTPVDVSGTKGFYGSFYDTTDQTNLTTINTISYNTTSEALGVSIASGTNVTVANAGTYNIQFSAVFKQTNSSASNVDLWLRKNGVDVAESNTEFTIAGTAQTVESWNFILTLNAGDYIQLVWYSAEATMRIEAIPAQVTPTRPGVPSIILTVQQVMFTQLGATIDGSNNYFLIKDGVNTATTTDVISTNGTDLNIKNSINLGSFGDGISNDITFNIGSGNGGQIFWDVSSGNLASISFNEPENVMRLIAPTYQMFSSDDSAITLGSVSGLGLTMGTRNKYIGITRYDNSYAASEGNINFPGSGVIQIGDDGNPASSQPSLKFASNITGTPQYGNMLFNGTTGDITIDTNTIIDNGTNTNNTIKASNNSTVTFTDGSQNATINYNSTFNRLTTTANRLALSANGSAIEMGGSLGAIYVTCPSNNTIALKRTDETEFSLLQNNIVSIGSIALTDAPTLQFDVSGGNMQLVYNNTNDRLEVTNGDLYALQNIQALGLFKCQGSTPEYQLIDNGGNIQSGLEFDDATNKTTLYGSGDISIEPATDAIINVPAGRAFYSKGAGVTNFYVSSNGNVSSFVCASGNSYVNLVTKDISSQSELKFTYGTVGPLDGFGILRPSGTRNLSFYNYALANNQLTLNSNGVTQFQFGNRVKASVDGSGNIFSGDTTSGSGRGGITIHTNLNDVSAASYYDIQKNKAGGTTGDTNELGGMRWYGYSTTYRLASSITAKVNGTTSGAFVPTDLIFSTCSASVANSERMRITASGTLAIGNTGSAPTQPVAIYSADNSAASWNGFAYFGNTTSRGVVAGALIVSGTRYAVIGGHSANLGAWDKITVGGSGNVGIGTVYDPAYQLEMNVDSAYKPGSAGLWTYTSDSRIKKNIVDADLGICFNNIKNMKLRRFEWDSDYYDEKVMKDRKVIGFIAQEVKEVFPKAVDIQPTRTFSKTLYDESGNAIIDEGTKLPKTIDKILDNVHSLNGDQIMNTHIGATQMLIKKVEDLEAINATLIARLEALETQLNLNKTI